MVVLWADVPEGHRVPADFLTPGRYRYDYRPVTKRRLLGQYTGTVPQCGAAIQWLVDPAARRWYTYPPAERFVTRHDFGHTGEVVTGVWVFARCPERTAPGAALCPKHGGPRLPRRPSRRRSTSPEDRWAEAWWRWAKERPHGGG